MTLKKSINTKAFCENIGILETFHGIARFALVFVPSLLLVFVVGNVDYFLFSSFFIKV